VEPRSDIFRVAAQKMHPRSRDESHPSYKENTMASANLAERIDAEFTALQEKQKKAQLENLQEYRDRQKRLQQFGQVLDSLADVWKPRLEVLQKKFGERVQVTPRMQPSTREALFEFQSNLAKIRLRFSATTDRDVKNVILNYDLDILPVLMQFDAHSEFAFPIDAPNREAIGSWVDDRIISFVHTYLSLHQNDYYLKDEMVEDPVAKVRFPKFAAGAKLEWQGQTYYFVGEDTKREFEKQKNAKSK
jgi:YHS domain-containing protein